MIAKQVCVFAICLATLFGDRFCMKVRICGKTVIRIRINIALKELNRRFSTAQRLPLRLAVRPARRLGMTEPTAAPMTRYTAVW